MIANIFGKENVKPPPKLDSLNNDFTLSEISKIEDEFSENKEYSLVAVVKEEHMTPFTAFSTIINIVLSTGPFTLKLSI